MFSYLNFRLFRHDVTSVIELTGEGYLNKIVVFNSQHDRKTKSKIEKQQTNLLISSTEQ